MLIDTHAHIVDSSFDHDRNEVLERAKAAGVKAVIAVAENVADAEKALLLSEQFPMLLPAAGQHPDTPDLEQAGQVFAWIHQHHKSLCAIGEVGLDYWKIKEEEEREIQREIFAHFIGLSKQYHLPLNVHSRSAGHHTIDFLLKHGAKQVQLHAFDGKASKALPAVEAGYYFSIPTSIVRDRQKEKLVKRLPLSALLVETDSPVLGPTREERNEPANVTLVIDAIATLKSLSPEEVSEAVTENSHRLYGYAISQY